MKAQFNIQNPDSVEMELTAVMSLSEWKRIAKDLSENVNKSQSSRSFICQIISMVNQAESKFTHETEEVE